MHLVVVYTVGIVLLIKRKIIAQLAYFEFLIHLLGNVKTLVGYAEHPM